MRHATRRACEGFRKGEHLGVERTQQIRKHVTLKTSEKFFGGREREGVF